MNTLTIKNLSKTYPNGVKALDAISLTISDGMFGLLGPNGAGKSSLMRTIAALQEPGEGNLYFNDIDILQQPQNLRNILGYLPQEFGVYPRFSAYKLLDHIAILKGVLNKGERKDQVEALLHQTNLYTHRKKSVSTFSGGMRQRFGIAQALLGDPKLIIVDEPTAGLDPEERNRFHNLLSDIASSRIILLSTHIVEDVRDLCTQMAILKEGRIVAKGVPAELIKTLNGKIWSTTIDKDKLPEYQNSYQVISSQLFAGDTHIHVYADMQPSSEFEPIVPGLEDVYFSTLYSHQPQKL
ncbi:ABC transporter ATP-binding protein [Aquimarina sp. 2201CG5-10]|uniref:ABC transporter ATP-binding protein n=1 Tax=Aquimarina callyspongiae TaxID=3098150 RepID=UPI002AB50D3A|nr:ABC transporter ATP-binding protein [Aquimarina sp. 2201CG5-10]MDY8136160.1 ABC transporter ATP-binding protein [Aquimarina sp. 2201CG5-10]